VLLVIHGSIRALEATVERDNVPDAQLFPLKYLIPYILILHHDHGGSQVPVDNYLTNLEPGLTKSGNPILISNYTVTYVLPALLRKRNLLYFKPLNDVCSDTDPLFGLPLTCG
jgi:hypothetical protein